VPEAPGGEEAPKTSLLTETREGLRAAAGIAGIRTVLAASGAALFFAGILNVGELPFAIEELGTSEAGYSMLAAALGLGFIGGSVAGARGGELVELKRRYLLGLLLIGVGLIASGLAPVLFIALATFGLIGFGNGLLLVYERLLIQRVVPDRLAGRVFGVKDALTAWAFGAAFLSAGAIIAVVGPRSLLLIAGAGSTVVWILAVLALRRSWVGEQAEGRHLPHRLDRAGDGRAGQNRANAVGGRDHWLTILDDLDEGRDNPRVELGAGVRD
jgi:MFS family permease